VHDLVATVDVPTGLFTRIAEIPAPEKWRPANVDRGAGSEEEGGAVRGTQQLKEIGQSLWLDNITRRMLNDGTLESYVHDFSVTGLTSNPSIFDKAHRSSTDRRARWRPSRGWAREAGHVSAAYIQPVVKHPVGDSSGGCGMSGVPLEIRQHRQRH